MDRHPTPETEAVVFLFEDTITLFESGVVTFDKGSYHRQDEDGIHCDFEGALTEAMRRTYDNIHFPNEDDHTLFHFTGYTVPHHFENLGFQVWLNALMVCQHVLLKELEFKRCTIGSYAGCKSVTLDDGIDVYRRAIKRIEDGRYEVVSYSRYNTSTAPCKR